MNKKRLIIVIVLAVVIVVVLRLAGVGNRVAKAPEISGVAVPTGTALQATSAAGATTTPLTVSVVLSTSTTKKYSGNSFSFDYPSSWNIFSAAPLFITDFNGQYEANGVIPADGAEISMVTTTISGNVDSIMAAELANAINATTSIATVDKTACAKATYQVDYAPGATVQNVSLYCSRGSELWKIYFSYPANDPAQKTDMSDLNEMLSSMVLLP